MTEVEGSPHFPNQVDHNSIFQNWWVHPFNGQSRRIYNLMYLSYLLKPKWAIETGTYFGSSTWLFLGVPTIEKVWSIESQEYPFEISKDRHRELISEGRLELVLGDSTEEIGKLLLSSIPREDPIILYLDAHWYGEIPTVKEVQILQERGGSWIAIVDDFKVDGEYLSQYGYDCYEGKCIDASLFSDNAGFSIFCVNEPSAKETGWRRGTGYLVSDEAISGLGAGWQAEMGLSKVG